MPGSSLELSPSTEQRLLAAAAVLRISPDALLRRLLLQHYNTLGGLPLDLLRYVFTFLDYSTISGLVARVSKFWQDCVIEPPQNVFSRLRQMHGIHLLDPVHGLFYFPRALKRVVFDTKGSSGTNPSSGGGGAAAALRSGGDLRRAFSSASAAVHGGAQTVPASSFLTVDIRTQNTKSLPWGTVQMTVRRAIEQERTEFGAVRTPGLQRPEDPVWSQAATVTYDRHIYMFGGETYEGVVLDRAYEYDPMTKHWAVLPDLNEKRAAASAVAFHGRIFVFGGYNEEGEVLDTYEVLDVATRSWVSRHYPPSWFYNTHAAPHARTSQKDKRRGQADRDDSDKFFAHARKTNVAATQPFKTTTGNLIDDPASLRPGFFHSISSMVRESTTGVGVAAAAASQYKMPEKICGTAATVYGEVILFAGGHQSCIAPDQTAVSYSAMNSASTTPMHSVGGPYAGGGPGSRSMAGTPSPAFGANVNSNNNNPTSGGTGGSSGAVGTPVLNTNYDGVTTPTTAGVHNNNSTMNNANNNHNNNNNTTTTNASTRTNTPPRLPRVNSIALDGPATAETLVWVFSPVTGEWWRGGPRLPSPRAFGALTVLELPVLGPCLCYFGGCARADAPETAMFYIPLGDAQNTRLAHGTRTRNDSTNTTFTTCEAADAPSQKDGPSQRTKYTRAAPGAEVKNHQGEQDDDEDDNSSRLAPPSSRSANFLHAAQDPWPASLRGVSPQSPQHAEVDGSHADTEGHEAAENGAVPGTTSAVQRSQVARAVFMQTHTAGNYLAPHTPTNAPALSPSATSAELDGTPFTTTHAPASATLGEAASGVDMIARCFRDTEELPWQRYVRVPIGGAFTSVAVLGSPHSRTVVLTGFYPAPNIGFCKVNHLLPPDAFTPLLAALSPPPPPPPLPAAAPTGEEEGGEEARGESSTGLHNNNQHNHIISRVSPPPPLQLDATLQDEAAAAANHYHQEREWSHHQRQEVRELVRAAARAATLRHPRNPQMAGEERRWSLAPVPEVRVRNPTGPALTRVSWKVQSLNAKVIVGIE